MNNIYQGRNHDEANGEAKGEAKPMGGLNLHPLVEIGLTYQKI